MSGLVWSARRCLVVAPHPDDETLGVGGTILRLVRSGTEVRVVYLTGGENNGLAQRFVERRWRLDAEAPERWAERRKQESIAALGVLGVPASSACFERLKDGGLDAGDAALDQTLRRTVAGFSPNLILSPSTVDLHSDHRATGQAVRAVCSGFPQVALFEYLVHGRGSGVPAVTVQLNVDERRLKRSAILEYSSQMALSRRRFLSFVTADEALFAPVPRPPVPFVTPRRWMEVLRG